MTFNLSQSRKFSLPARLVGRRVIVLQSEQSLLRNTAKMACEHEP